MRLQRKRHLVSAKDGVKTSYEPEERANMALAVPLRFGELPPSWKQHTTRPRKGIQHWFDGIESDSDDDDCQCQSVTSVQELVRDTIYQGYDPDLRAAKLVDKEVSSSRDSQQERHPHPLQCHPYQPISPLTSTYQGTASRASSPPQQHCEPSYPKRSSSLQKDVRYQAKRLRPTEPDKTTARNILVILEESPTRYVSPSTGHHPLLSDHKIMETSPSMISGAQSPIVMGKHSILPVILSPSKNGLGTECDKALDEISIPSSPTGEAGDTNGYPLPSSTAHTVSNKIDVPLPSPFGLRFSVLFEEAQASASSPLLAKRGRHLRALCWET